MSEALVPIEAERVNRHTGEVVPFEAGDAVEFHGHVGAGTLALSDRQAAVLMDALPDEDHDILPTGEVYVSHVFVRRKLNEVFGPGGWALVPRGPFTTQGNTVCREYALIVGGRFISEAIGESDYQPNNPRMSWASACEAAKSNALTRCCKDLGIASECWDRRFCDDFIARFCVQVWMGKGEKPRWRRKDGRPIFGETGMVKQGGTPLESKPESHQAGREPGDDADEQMRQYDRESSSDSKATSSRAATSSGKTVTCPHCGKQARESKFPKTGSEFYCYGCKAPIDKDGNPAVER
jgi:hypothetical protein